MPNTRWALFAGSVVVSARDAPSLWICKVDGGPLQSVKEEIAEGESDGNTMFLLDEKNLSILSDTGPQQILPPSIHLDQIRSI